MSMTAHLLAMVAAGKARQGHDVDIEALTPTRARLAVTDGAGARALTVSTTISGFPHLADTHRQVTLPEAEAVRAVAAWVDGTELPTPDEPAPDVPQGRPATTQAAEALAEIRARIQAHGWPPAQTRESISAAAQYLAGRLDLDEAAQAVRAGETALSSARAELRGAAIAALACGTPKSTICRTTGISRATFDRWLEPHS